MGSEAFGWRERRSAPRAGERYRTGVGVACGAHKNGILSETFTDFSTMTAKMNEDGSVALTASMHEMGAGVITVMQLIVAEELGIGVDDVSVTEADSDATPYDFGCYGSRITYVCGAAAQQTTAILRRRLLANAAALSGAAEDDLEIADGAVRSRDGSLRLSFADVVMRTKLERGEDIYAHHTHTATSNPGSYCAQFAEVVVDCATGLTRVTDFLVVADIGRALNPVLARGQYHGGVQMGIGYALCEEVRIDDLGRPAPGGFELPPGQRAGHAGRQGAVRGARRRRRAVQRQERRGDCDRPHRGCRGQRDEPRARGHVHRPSGDAGEGRGGTGCRGG